MKLTRNDINESRFRTDGTVPRNEKSVEDLNELQTGIRTHLYLAAGVFEEVSDIAFLDVAREVSKVSSVWRS